MRTKSEQLEFCRTCAGRCSTCSDNKYVKKIQYSVSAVGNLSPVANDPHFSKAPCRCCDDQLAGNRYEFDAESTDKSNPIIRMSCCVDCFGYLFA